MCKDICPVPKTPSLCIAPLRGLPTLLAQHSPLNTYNSDTGFYSCGYNELAFHSCKAICLSFLL
uniref:Uncharacterized protein n=1 Tax=Anguilla anguilla TaxID=7936 RepID=A0A0E9PAK4_ANGAN